MERLPEGCVSHALSLTAPLDACRASLVSAAFRSAADSDAVWETFLPPDYRQILSRAVHPVAFASKKELFFTLCNPILVDGGKMSFAIDRLSGRKCYMLSARELGISWGNEECYWKWTSSPDSRFPEVAELFAVCWLDIHGKIDSRLLSPKTTYVAYLIFKITSESFGLHSPPQETIVNLGVFKSIGTVRLQSTEERREAHERMHRHDYHLRRRSRILLAQFGQTVSGESDDTTKESYAREDGWREIELGEFFNVEGDDGDVEMRLREIEVLNWKKGLIIQGIEVRPKL